MTGWNIIAFPYLSVVDTLKGAASGLAGLYCQAAFDGNYLMVQRQMMELVLKQKKTILHISDETGMSMAIFTISYLLRL